MHTLIAGEEAISASSAVLIVYRHLQAITSVHLPASCTLSLPLRLAVCRQCQSFFLSRLYPPFPDPAISKKRLRLLHARAGDPPDSLAQLNALDVSLFPCEHRGTLSSYKDDSQQGRACFSAL